MIIHWNPPRPVPDSLTDCRICEYQICMVPNACVYWLAKINPWFTDTLIFSKADKLSFSTTSIWSVRSALNNMDTHWLFLYCASPSVDSKTKHCVSTVVHLASLSIIQQQRDSKMWPHYVQQPDYTIPHKPKVYQKPWMMAVSIFWPGSGGFNGVCFKGVPLYPQFQMLQRDIVHLY